MTVVTRPDGSVEYEESTEETYVLVTLYPDSRVPMVSVHIEHKGVDYDATTANVWVDKRRA